MPSSALPGDPRYAPLRSRPRSQRLARRHGAGRFVTKGAPATRHPLPLLLLSRQTTAPLLSPRVIESRMAHYHAPHVLQRGLPFGNRPVSTRTHRLLPPIGSSRSMRQQTCPQRSKAAVMQRQAPPRNSISVPTPLTGKPRCRAHVLRLDSVAWLSGHLPRFRPHMRVRPHASHHHRIASRRLPCP